MKIWRRALFLVLILFTFFFLVFGAVQAETTPPMTTANLSPPTPNGQNDWYVNPIEVVFAASDLESGVKSISWRRGTGSWNVTSFENTVNLVPNSSFEEATTPPISSWAFQGQPGSSGSQSTANFLFGQASAQIVSAQNGWNGFNHALNYVPADPFDNMNASVWVKSQDLLGEGVYLKIYALSPLGSTLIAQSGSLTTAESWTRLSKSFYVSVNDAYGVYLDLGLQGTGTVWLDGASLTNALLDTSVYQTFSQNGFSAVEYYAVDNGGNQEAPAKSFSAKIDTVAPQNWQGFETERSGNEHTLMAKITVKDNASGLDPVAGFFQYSLDSGQTWGHYENLTNCSSTWINDGWRELTTAVTDSGLTGTLETPAVDYCSSNWAVCKVIRFKTTDLAGNSSSKDICLNGSWFRSTGDVGSRSDISLTAAGATDNSDGVITSAVGINNFTSSGAWYVNNYLLTPKPSYDEWLAQFPTNTALPGGKLPKISGLFVNDGGFTVSGTTIPTGFSTAEFSAVVYINGDLTINTDFSLSGSSALAFIVAGDIRIDKRVKNLAAFFLADGKFEASYNGTGNDQLTIQGSVVVDYLTVNRSLKAGEGEATPVLDIVYQASYLNRLNALMGSDEITWREINP